MTHPRAQIRAAFVDRLTDATAAEERETIKLGPAAPKTESALRWILQ